MYSRWMAEESQTISAKVAVGLLEKRKEGKPGSKRCRAISRGKFPRGENYEVNSEECVWNL